MDLASVQLYEYIKIIKYIVQLRITELITLVLSQDKIFTVLQYYSNTVYSESWKPGPKPGLRIFVLAVRLVPYYEKIIIIIICNNNF